MVDNVTDPKDERGWSKGTATYGFGYDANGHPVRQLAGDFGRGTDAKDVAGVGAVFCSVVTLSQAQYDALAVKDPAILYVIPGA